MHTRRKLKIIRISQFYKKKFENFINSNERKGKDVGITKSIHKTEMQLLTLKEESINLITATLKHLYGDDFEFTADGYKNKHSKIKNSYWKEKGQLVIKGGSDYSHLAESGGQGKMKMYAILKLESYGFENRHCYEGNFES
jgi:ATP-dependent RNA helicase DHX57